MEVHYWLIGCMFLVRAHCMVHIQENNLSISSSEFGVIKCSKFVVLKFRVKGLDWKLKPPTLNSISRLLHSGCLYDINTETR